VRYAVWFATDTGAVSWESAGCGLLSVPVVETEAMACSCVGSNGLGGWVEGWTRSCFWGWGVALSDPCTACIFSLFMIVRVISFKQG
jgi:hypothetical protein